MGYVIPHITARPACTILYDLWCHFWVFEGGDVNNDLVKGKIKRGISIFEILLCTLFVGIDHVLKQVWKYKYGTISHLKQNVISTADFMFQIQVFDYMD